MSCLLIQLDWRAWLISWHHCAEALSVFITISWLPPGLLISFLLFLCFWSVTSHLNIAGISTWAIYIIHLGISFRTLCSEVIKLNWLFFYFWGNFPWCSIMCCFCWTWTMNTGYSCLWKYWKETDVDILIFRTKCDQYVKWVILVVFETCVLLLQM